MINKEDEIRIRKKIGQVIFCGFTGYQISENLKNLIDKYYLGNIIFFTRNYQNPKQMKQLNKDIYSLIENKTGYIPLTAIDQEGGNVTRMMNDVTFPPSPMSCSQSHIDSACFEIGKIIGKDMIMLGLNLNLAPCLDINSKDPYYANIRHYSSDPDEVCKYTHDFIKGLSYYGVLSCLKHFPGAGEDVVDTHFNASILTRSIKEIEEHELIPFKYNIDSPCIMTTHTIFKAIDDLPSTLSSKVIKGYLRDKMNYQGIVITDALEMKAIDDYYGAVKASLMALNAGADMILCCHDYQVKVDTFEYLYDCVINGSLKESTLDEKIERIAKYKNKLRPYLNKYFYNEEEYQVSIAANDFSYQVVKASFQLIKGRMPTLKNNTLLIAPELYAINGAEDVFDDRSLPQALNANFKNDVIVLDNKESTKNKILNALDKYDSVIAFSYNVNIDKVNVDIINEVNNRKNTFIISLKGMMDINLYDNLRNYAVLYEYSPNSIKVLIELLKRPID